jgi:hypothetical protein
MQAYHDRNYDQVMQTFEKWLRTPSDLENYPALTNAKIKARLDQMKRFLEWQDRNDGDFFTKHNFDSLDQRLAEISSLIANQDPLDEHEAKAVRREPFQAWQAVHEIIFRPDLQGDDDARGQRDKDIWRNVLAYGEIPLSPVERDRQALREGTSSQKLSPNALPVARDELRYPRGNWDLHARSDERQARRRHGDLGRANCKDLAAALAD